MDSSNTIVYVKLPQKRGDFVDPGFIDWDTSKDAKLRKVIDEEGSTMDLEALSKSLGVPFYFLKHQIDILKICDSKANGVIKTLQTADPQLVNSTPLSASHSALLEKSAMILTTNRVAKLKLVSLKSEEELPLKESEKESYSDLSSMLSTRQNIQLLTVLAS